jgi:protein-disulfide isomerase
VIATIALPCLLLTLPSSGWAQGISSQQADEMLKELRAIRVALERVTGGQPAPNTPPPEQRGKLARVRGPIMGNPNAPITLVEFTDLQCPYCNRFTSTTFEQLKKTYIDTGKVRFISRDFPLDFHPQAMAAARAARCADDQGRFWEMRATLGRNFNKLSPAFITSAATELKLDMKAFETCVASTKHDARINSDLDAARGLGVEGTPTFLLGPTTGDTLEGVLVIGALPFEVFDAKMKELLAPKK